MERNTLFLGLGVAAVLALAGCSGAPPCGPRTCSGCCDSAGGCRAGDSAAACGNTGHACTQCSSIEHCQAGICILAIASNRTEDSGHNTTHDAGPIDASHGDGGDLGHADGGTCTSSTCAVGEICHPTEKVCVKTCLSGSDCPDAGTTDGGPAVCPPSTVCGRILYGGTKTGDKLSVVLHDSDPPAGPPLGLKYFSPPFTFPIPFQINVPSARTYYFRVYIDVQAGDGYLNRAVDPYNDTAQSTVPSSGGAQPIDIELADP